MYARMRQFTEVCVFVRFLCVRVRVRAHVLVRVRVRVRVPGPTAVL